MDSAEGVIAAAAAAVLVLLVVGVCGRLLMMLSAAETHARAWESVTPTFLSMDWCLVTEWAAAITTTCRGYGGRA